MYLIKRLAEPSTWAGVSVLGLLLGLPPGTFEAAGQIVAGIAALGAIFAPENKAS